MGGESVDQLVEFGVASVLVGAFPIEGLNVEASLVAIVEGLLAANDTFRRFEAAAKEAGRPTSSVRVTALEVIERYADRAELAAHAVRLLPQLLDRVESLDDLIENTEVVVEIAPGRAAVPPAAGGGGGVVAAGDDHGERRPAEHTSICQGCRSAHAGARRDRDGSPRPCRPAPAPGRSVTVDNLVATAISETSPDAQVTNTLWELLLPVDLKEGVIGTGRHPARRRRADCELPVGADGIERAVGHRAAHRPVGRASGFAAPVSRGQRRAALPSPAGGRRPRLGDWQSAVRSCPLPHG